VFNQICERGFVLMRKFLCLLVIGFGNTLNVVCATELFGNTLLSDFTIEQDPVDTARLDSYYANLVRELGNDPYRVPFLDAEVVIKRGQTITSISRRHIIEGMDPVHLAAALYLNNQQAFRGGDPNILEKNVVLRMPTNTEIGLARELYEHLLRKNDSKNSAGFFESIKPMPRVGKNVPSAKRQGRAWLNLSSLDKTKYRQRDFSEVQLPAASYNEGGGAAVSWQVNGIPIPDANPAPNYDLVFNDAPSDVGEFTELRSENSRGFSDPDYIVNDTGEKVAVCPHCGLPLDVVERGRLLAKKRNPYLRAKDAPPVKRQSVNTWQRDTSAEQIRNPAAEGFYISEPVSKGQFTSQRKSSVSEYDPFGSTINWSFPASTTVGDAVQYVADYIGYHLEIDDDRVALSYSRRLPVVHREVKGLSTKGALELLGGTGLMVAADHSVRTIKHTIGDIERAAKVGSEILQIRGMAVCKDDVTVPGKKKQKRRLFSRKKASEYQVVMLRDGSKCIYM